MRPPVLYGIISVTLIAVMYLTIYYTGNLFKPVGQYSRLISLALMLPFIILAIVWRRKALGGEIGYRESIKAGMTTSLIIAVGLAVFTYFLFKLKFSGEYMTDAQNYAVSQKLDRDKAYELIKGTYMFYLPSSQAMSTVMWTLIAGFIMSLASSTFLVRKRGERD
jgi:hypothetical protein